MFNLHVMRLNTRWSIIQKNVPVCQNFLPHSKSLSSKENAGHREEINEKHVCNIQGGML